MTTSERSSLRRRFDDGPRHRAVFVGGFASVVLALLLVVLLGGGRTAEVAYDLLLPAAMFYAPPAVAAINAQRNGDLLTSVAVGVVPALSFAVVSAVRLPLSGASTAEAPIWALVLGFAVVGVVGALVGHAVGRGLRIAFSRLR